MTYYRNYNSKEDIFSSFLQDIVNDYHEETKDKTELGSFYDKERLTHCFTYFAIHKDFIRVLFKNGMGYRLLMTLTNYLLWKWYDVEKDDIEMYYTLQAFSGSLFNLYIAWSLRDTAESPEAMAGVLAGIYG